MISEEGFGGFSASSSCQRSHRNLDSAGWGRTAAPSNSATHQFSNQALLLFHVQVTDNRTRKTRRSAVTSSDESHIHQKYQVEVEAEIISAARRSHSCK